MEKEENERDEMAEPFCVQQEGDEGKEGGDETEDGEHAEPDHREVLVLVREQDLLSTPECLQIFNDKTGGSRTTMIPVCFIKLPC